MKSYLPAALIAIAVLASTQFSGAVTITFDSLTGSNGATFTTTTENGFIVASTSGAWLEGQSNGNPVPSIFSRSDAATVTITRDGGGFFEFVSVDLDDGNSGDPLGPNYSISGFDSGLVFNQAGGEVARGWTTTVNSASNAPISSLTISMNRLQTTSFNIDNIVVRERGRVPSSGSTLAMLAFGVVGLAGFRKLTRK